MLQYRNPHYRWFIIVKMFLGLDIATQWQRTCPAYMRFRIWPSPLLLTLKKGKKKKKNNKNFSLKRVCMANVPSVQTYSIYKGGLD